MECVNCGDRFAEPRKTAFGLHPLCRDCGEHFVLKSHLAEKWPPEHDFTLEQAHEEEFKQ